MAKAGRALPRGVQQAWHRVRLKPPAAKWLAAGGGEAAGPSRLWNTLPCPSSPAADNLAKTHCGWSLFSGFSLLIHCGFSRAAPHFPPAALIRLGPRLMRCLAAAGSGVSQPGPSPSKTTNTSGPLLKPNFSPFPF